MDTGAKTLSKWTIIGATVFILVLTLLKAAWGLVTEKPFGLTVWEILAVGGVLVVLWTPVYASIYIDKLSSKVLEKIGGKDE